MVMSAERDEYREDRITMRAVVDAYGSEERALGWYYYLENELRIPFRARDSPCGAWVKSRPIN